MANSLEARLGLHWPGDDHRAGLGRGRLSEEEAPEPPPPKVEETVKDLAWVYSTGEVKLEGVGLVFGLDNTGADAAPGWYRQKLIDEMRKARSRTPT